MLSFFDSSNRPDRRAFLRVGALGLAGLSLTDLLTIKARASEARRRVVKDKSVIFLFLHGGPSQIETFDPKMTAPAEFRSATGEVRTCLPGVTFGGTYPRLAGRADKLSIVRSFVTGDGNHDIKTIVGRDTFGANLGCYYAQVAGRNDPVTGLPSNVCLFPRAVEPAAQPANMNFGRFNATGILGPAFAPFDPSAGGEVINDMRLSMSLDRLSDRRMLRDQLDRIDWAASETRLLDGMDRVREQALGTLIGGVADAFDLSRENQRVVEHYDTARLVRPESIDRRWRNYNNYVDNARSLGRLLLLGRRLCERGAGFVTITTSFVWDMHADVNNAPVAEGMGYMGPPLDHAVSAFVDDLEARGLSEKILLVACGEMGRTPRINAQGGRDHWGNLAPLLLAGGGLQMGQVIGRSDSRGGEPAAHPVRIQNLVATILHTLFDVGELRLLPGLPRELTQVMTGWAPIGGLV